MYMKLPYATVILGFFFFCIGLKLHFNALGKLWGIQYTLLLYVKKGFKPTTEIIYHSANLLVHVKTLTQEGTCAANRPFCVKLTQCVTSVGNGALVTPLRYHSGV